MSRRRIGIVTKIVPSRINILVFSPFKTASRTIFDGFLEHRHGRSHRVARCRHNHYVFDPVDCEWADVVLTGLREPERLRVSALFQDPPRYGITPTMSPEDIANVYRKQQYDYHFLHPDFYLERLRDYYGIDVYAKPWPRCAPYVVYHTKHLKTQRPTTVIIYKMEMLTNDTWKSIQREAGITHNISPLKCTNLTSEKKEYKDAYNKVKEILEPIPISTKAWYRYIYMGDKLNRDLIEKEKFNGELVYT